ncbi:metal-dependent hydrolase [Sphaerisporangium sp. TRM90804]|uniref:metal-dependent hydrolase n=1 Tax=Sphaerisporangium sp. TRM90804 TaxID=3031113 RepID=UPI00244D4628|nr:metal-dependent hydrolase [Sphaerisporangium sp. TRM90804]MDH2425015.1 metal-dependent hydrolase [Sphaerisporangium sp. TRM90804]
MSFPTESTVVLFPQGVGECEARIVLAEPAGDDGALLVATDRTPFHPIDHTWPDQPGDRGTATVRETEHTVVDAITMAVGPDGSVHRGEAIPARRTDPGWAFLVGHVVEMAADTPPAALVGNAVTLKVDTARRASLSAAHTGAHLMSLALNMELRDLWRKSPRVDCLGHPDFDQLAITTSRMSPGQSVDRYRLGKSLRKAGLEVAVFLERIDSVQEAVTARLAEWIAAGGCSVIETEGPGLTARRWWTCELPAGRARIPCGGTHLGGLGELSSLDVRFEAGERELVVYTTAKQA